MNRTKRLLAPILLLLTTVVVCLLLPQSVRAWGEHGHCIRAQAAAQKLPMGMLPFFRSASDQLAYPNPEPDRWRDIVEDKQDGAINSAAASEHNLDFELISNEALAARDRYDFLVELTRSGMLADQTGLLPLEILDSYQMLRVELRLWRTTTDEQQRRFIRQRIINDAGIQHIVSFDEQTTAPEDKWCAVARLAAGAEMLRDLWWTTWATSDGSRPVIGYSQAGRTGSVDTAAKQVIQRIDVGNTASYTDSEGRMWSPDTGLFMPERAFAESRGKPQIAGAADPTIYHTYRGNVGGKTPQAERILSFEIPVRGHRKVDVRLHFVEIYWGAPGGGPPGPGKRLFDVEAEGRKMLEDFDITKASGGALTAIVVPIKDVEVSDGKLTLVFRAKKDFAAVSAIEVLADN